MLNLLHGQEVLELVVVGYLLDCDRRLAAAVVAPEAIHYGFPEGPGRGQLVADPLDQGVRDCREVVHVPEQ